MKTWKVTSAGRIAFGGLLVAGLCASTLMWSRYHQADPLLEPPPVGHNAVPAFEEAHAIAGECQAFLDNGTALPAHVRVSGLRFCELSNFCVPRLVPAVGSAPPGSRQPEGTDTKVTFFVRTYGGQMPKGSDVDVSFQDFIASLQRLADPAWEAVVFDTAVRYNPFTGLKEFVSGLKDPRVHVIQLPEAVLLDKVCASACWGPAWPWPLFGLAAGPRMPCTLRLAVIIVRRVPVCLHARRSLSLPWGLGSYRLCCTWWALSRVGSPV